MTDRSVEERTAYVRDFFAPGPGERPMELPKDGFNAKAPAGCKSFYSASYLYAGPEGKPLSTSITPSRLSAAVVRQILEDLAARGLAPAVALVATLGNRELEGDLLDKAREIITNAQLGGGETWPTFGFPALLSGGRKPPGHGVFRDPSKYLRPGWSGYYGDRQQRWGRGLPIV